jgi:hypothetical protein
MPFIIAVMRLSSSLMSSLLPWRISSRLLVIAACAALVVPVLMAAKGFEKPVAQAAKTYPAHDDHSDVKVAIAADPYDTAEKAKIFSTDFKANGLLPVFFVVTNDGEQPISIAHMEVTLITANHSKLTPIATEDLYRRLSNPQANTAPNPFPIPRKTVKNGMSKRQMDEIESSQFAARAVEPHATQSGFLFFDVGGITSPLADANMDIDGVADAKGNELLFFEIPMDNYVNAGKQ